jgi:outer membrane protein
VRLDAAPGFVLNAGMDYEAAPNWLLNLDVRRLFVRTDAEVNSGLVRARAVVDPWIVAAALRYRF